MKQYKVIRIDIETYKNFLSKQIKINNIYSKITGKPKKVPFSKVLKISSTSPIFYMGEKNLIKTIGGEI